MEQIAKKSTKPGVIFGRMRLGPGAYLTLIRRKMITPNNCSATVRALMQEVNNARGAADVKPMTFDETARKYAVDEPSTPEEEQEIAWVIQDLSNGVAFWSGRLDRQNRSGHALRVVRRTSEVRAATIVGLEATVAELQAINAALTKKVAAQGSVAALEAEVVVLQVKLLEKTRETVHWKTELDAEKARGPVLDDVTRLVIDHDQLTKTLAAKNERIAQLQDVLDRSVRLNEIDDAKHFARIAEMDQKLKGMTARAEKAEGDVRRLKDEVAQLEEWQTDSDDETDSEPETPSKARGSQTCPPAPKKRPVSRKLTYDDGLVLATPYDGPKLYGQGNSSKSWSLGLLNDCIASDDTEPVVVTGTGQPRAVDATIKVSELQNQIETLKIRLKNAHADHRCTMDQLEEARGRIDRMKVMAELEERDRNAVLEKIAFSIQCDRKFLNDFETDDKSLAMLVADIRRKIRDYENALARAEELADIVRERDETIRKLEKKVSVMRNAHYVNLSKKDDTIRKLREQVTMMRSAHDAELDEEYKIIDELRSALAAVQNDGPPAGYVTEIEAEQRAIKAYHDGLLAAGSEEEPRADYDVEQEPGVDGVVEDCDSDWEFVGDGVGKALQERRKRKDGPEDDAHQLYLKTTLNSHYTPAPEPRANKEYNLVLPKDDPRWEQWGDKPRHAPSIWCSRMMENPVQYYVTFQVTSRGTDLCPDNLVSGCRTAELELVAEHADRFWETRSDGQYTHWQLDVYCQA